MFSRLISRKNLVVDYKNFDRFQSLGQPSVNRSVVSQNRTDNRTVKTGSKRNGCNRTFHILISINSDIICSEKFRININTVFGLNVYCNK